jgi:hypothetical protein
VQEETVKIATAKDDLRLIAPTSTRIAAQQVPPVSLNIQKDGDLSIRLNARGGDEPDPGLYHPRVRLVEIIDSQEETDPAGKLLANDRRLVLAVGACEQNAGNGPSGTNDDPSLRPPIIRQRWNVLDELELQDVHKEIDCRFVLSDDQRDQLEL